MKFKLFSLIGLGMFLASTAYSAPQSIQCTDSVKSLGKNNSTGPFTVTCPANCTGSGSVWGTGTFTTDSKICKAAIHSGIISAASGGNVFVVLKAGLGAYVGTARNGIKTNSWGSYGKSFIVAKAGGLPGKIACGDSVKSLGKASSPEFTVICPAGCTTGSVWGTGTYTIDSKICVAAVHDGVISSGAGGWVKVRLAAGLPGYTGSSKNGVTTRKWGTYPKSFKVLK